VPLAKRLTTPWKVTTGGVAAAGDVEMVVDLTSVNWMPVEPAKQSQPHP